MEKRKMDPRIVKYFLLAAVLVLGIRYFNVLWEGREICGASLPL